MCEMEYHKVIVPSAPADLTFEMVSQAPQLPAPFDLAKGIWPPAQRQAPMGEGSPIQIGGEI